MKNLFDLKLVKTSILALSVCMAACTDEADELSGPDIKSEEFTNGFLKGTLSGTRKDGESFSGEFDFKKNYDKEIAFVEDNASEDIQRLYLSWENEKNDNNAEITLKIENKGTASEKVNISYFELDYTSPLENRTGFGLRAGSNFTERVILFPISPSNTDYNFIFVFPSTSATGLEYYYDNEISQLFYFVKDKEGNVVYFEDYYRHSHYDPQTGQHYYYGNFAYLIDKEGVKSTTSEQYGNLTLRRTNGNNGLAIFDENGTDLSEAITTVDQQTITNFQYDESTGLLSFEYEITLDKYSAPNSSGNEIKIQGKAEVTITYDKMINRAPAQEML